MHTDQRAVSLLHLDTLLSKTSELLCAPNVEDLADYPDGSRSVVPAIPIKQKVGLLKLVTLLLCNGVSIPHLEQVHRSVIRIGLIDRNRLTRGYHKLPAGAPEEKQEEKKEARKEEKKVDPQTTRMRNQKTNQASHHSPTEFLQSPSRQDKQIELEQMWTELALAASTMRMAYRRFRWKNRDKFEEGLQREGDEKKEDLNLFEVSDEQDFASEGEYFSLSCQFKQMKKQLEEVKARVSELEARPIVELSLANAVLTKHTHSITTVHNIITGCGSNASGNMSIGGTFTTVCIVISLPHAISLFHLM